jgi:hypothetical protein
LPPNSYWFYGLDKMAFVQTRVELDLQNRMDCGHVDFPNWWLWNSFGIFKLKLDKLACYFDKTKHNTKIHIHWINANLTSAQILSLLRLQSNEQKSLIHVVQKMMTISFESTMSTSLECILLWKHNEHVFKSYPFFLCFEACRRKYWECRS